MKVKYNESTDLRPEGGRLIDAPLVIIDIKENIKHLRSEPAWENSDRNAMTLYKTNGMSVVLIALHEDTLIKKHTNDGIICVQVLEGEINFITDEQQVVLKKNQMISLHKGIAHSVAAIKESVFLLTLNASPDKKF